MLISKPIILKSVHAIARISTFNLKVFLHQYTRLKPKYWRWACFTLFSSCFTFASLEAQQLQKPLRIITTKDGLPQSFVSGLVQDKEGFVWIGTRNGLTRYDGIHFKLFQHKSNDTTTLASNLIISLSKDKVNRIWIEHESSNIDYIDPGSEKIEHVTNRRLFRSHPIIFTRKGWISDADDNLWCIQKSKGLYKYDWKNNKVTHFTKKTHGLASDTIRGLLEDRQKNIWIINQEGISLYDPAKGRLINLPVPARMEFSNDETSDDEIVGVHERTNGEIMFGDRHNLFFYNPDKKSFRLIQRSGDFRKSIHSIQTGPDQYDYFESQGLVYRYGNSTGLMAVGDISLETFRDAQSFLVDRAGLIWLGTNAAGIHQIDLNAPLFESYPNLVFFHYDLFRQEFDETFDQIFKWTVNSQRFTTSYLFRSTYDLHSKLWIALWNGVAYYDSSLKKFIRLPPVPGISNLTNLSWGIRGISFAPDNTLWVIGDRGYITYFDAVSQNWIKFDDISSMRGTDPNFTLNDVVADEDKIWMSSGGSGLLCIDKATRQLRQYSTKHYPDLLPTNQLLGLKADPERADLIWIGTYEGLICFNKKTLTSEVFTTEQGLPDNTIYAIQADRSGYLWLSTNKGICRIHPVTHKVRIFSSGDGLPGDEFNRFHNMRLPDGRLAFGGTNGWVLFDPTVIRPDNFQTPVAFTNFKINNEPVNYNSAKSLLSAPLNNIRVLSLPYDQNTLTFEFAGLEFNQPKKILYRYQLINSDNKWVVTDNPVVNYTKLPAGHYTLNINASNTTGQWSSKVRSLSIVIRPPFWRSWWAYCFYVLFFAGFIWLYIQYRLNRERMMQEVLLKEKEALQLKAVDELKTRFFSNITHEFRTPLTLILTPVQRLQSSLKQQKHLHWLSTIERNAEQLLRLINQLLDFSKLESGTLKVHETRGNICNTIEGFLQSFYDQAEANGVSLKLTAHDDIGDYWFDADKLEKIIRNLVANALKFTPIGGQVEVICQVKNNVAVTNENTLEKPGILTSGIFLTIRDTGIGIPPEQLPFIFNRFYQIENITGGRSAVNHPKGSGIGLALVKELVDMQGGYIEVSSDNPTSTGWHAIFAVWLPYQRAISTDRPVNEETTAFQQPLDKTSSSLQNILIQETSVSKNWTEGSSILLVEDNDELAEFIADSLPKLYSVRRAANGAEGLEKSFELMPDLIISDVLMPVMDGYEFCSKIKHDKRTSHIPVILLTAKATFENRIEGLSLGADDYLTKPFHIKELQLRVHNLLERQRLLREKLRLELSEPNPPGIGVTGREQAALHEPFLKELYDLIEEKLDDSSFGVQALALKVGMSRSNLYNKLKALTGLPAGDIIRNYRLKRAAHFLEEGSNSSETSYKVGFESPAYFSKCFKEFYKVSPMEFVQKK